MEKISVVVPVYNVVSYLERCVESILRQTYKNLEIILVDDGSNDGSEHLCDLLCTKDPDRIKVVHKKNGGLSDARNVGLQNATGKYIAFVDSDDYLHHNAYEILMHFLNEYDADIVEGDYLKVVEQQIDKEYKGAKVEVCNRNQALVNMMRWKLFDISVWNKLYKREVLEGLLFPVGKINEDEFWTYKTYFKANKLVHVYFPIYYYQQMRSGSILTKPFSKKNYNSTEALLERVEYMKNYAPELVEEANISVLTHVFHHLNNFVLNEKRPYAQWKEYFEYYCNMLLNLPDDLIESYKKTSMKKRFKVKLSQFLIRIDKNLFRICFSIVARCR